MSRATAWLATACVAGIAACFVIVDHPLEGPVLLSFSQDHGLHVSDLVVAAVAAAVLAAVWRRTRRRPAA